MPQERDIAASNARQPAGAGASMLSGCYDQSWAVVIGINAYRSVDALEFARSDAEAVAGALTGAGFPQNHIFTLLDDQATRQNIQDLISSDLPRQSGANDRLLVFFCGPWARLQGPNGPNAGLFYPR